MPIELVKTEDEQFMTPVDGVDDTEDEGAAPVIPAEQVVTPEKTDDVVDGTTEEPEVNLWPDGTPESKVQPEVPDKKRPDRYQFQQSRADKAEAALKAREARIAELEAERQRMLADPTIASRLAPSQTETPLKPEDTLKKPVRPTKPANYDPVEAVTNPTSESAKYRFAMDDFNDQLAEFNEKKAEIGEQREAQARAVAKAQAEERAKVIALAKDLKSKYGFNDSQIQDFLKTVTSDEAMTIENLVRFYSVVKAGKNDTRRPAPKTNRSMEPLPLSALSGAPNETIDDQDSFNLGLLRNRRKPVKY
jgi:DNA-binding protein H-NS